MGIMMKNRKEERNEDRFDLYDDYQKIGEGLFQYECFAIKCHLFFSSEMTEERKQGIGQMFWDWREKTKENSIEFLLFYTETYEEDPLEELFEKGTEDQIFDKELIISIYEETMQMKCKLKDVYCYMLDKEGNYRNKNNELRKTTGSAWRELQKEYMFDYESKSNGVYQIYYQGKKVLFYVYYKKGYVVVMNDKKYTFDYLTGKEIRSVTEQELKQIEKEVRLSLLFKENKNRYFFDKLYIETHIREDLFREMKKTMSYQEIEKRSYEQIQNKGKHCDCETISQTEGTYIFSLCGLYALYDMKTREVEIRETKEELLKNEQERKEKKIREILKTKRM